TSSRGFRRSRTMWLDSIARMVHRPLNSRAGRRTPACCRDPPDRRWTDRRPGPRRRGSAASPGVDLLGVGAGGAEQVPAPDRRVNGGSGPQRSEEHTSELQSRVELVCRLLLEKKKVDEEDA